MIEEMVSAAVMAVAHEVPNADRICGHKLMKTNNYKQATRYAQGVERRRNAEVKSVLPDGGLGRYFSLHDRENIVARAFVEECSIFQGGVVCRPIPGGCGVAFEHEPGTYYAALFFEATGTAFVIYIESAEPIPLDLRERLTFLSC